VVQAIIYKAAHSQNARDVCVVCRHSSACRAVVPDGFNAGTKYRKIISSLSFGASSRDAIVLPRKQEEQTTTKYPLY